ncbi:MAG: GNAT family N-acetyltransferase [Acidimicrobiales bacterium]
MEAGVVLVDRVLEVTDDLVEVMARLVPQLSSTAVPPGRAGLEEIVTAPASTLLIARLGSREAPIVGMTTLIVYRIPTGLHAVIEDVVVDESARGHGVGAELVSRAVQIAREKGALHVNLTSRASRQAANHLYTKAGFVQRETNVYRLSLG